MKRTRRCSSLFRTLSRLLLLGAFLIALGVGIANWRILTANADRLPADLSRLPTCDVALVLGTSPYFQDGRANLHFEGRMNAAAELYKSGKVKHLLVSGDNRALNYNEPVMMRKALIERGVPARAITCDFAGFRTLDSVVRAREVFGLKRCIIVTQRYHNTRALEIARARGLDAWGWCAEDVELAHSLKTEIREVFARTLTLLDLYVWNRQPYFLGKPEVIPVSS